MNLNNYLVETNNFICIDLKKSCIDHLTLKASVNGIEGVFILDTASNKTVVDVSKKIRFKLKQVAPVKNTTGVHGNQIKTVHSPRNQITIGGITLPDFQIAALNLIAVNNEIKNRKGEPIDGLIGGDVLKQLKGVIDYGGLKLYITNPMQETS